jgi:hypothetical protein
MHATRQAGVPVQALCVEFDLTADVANWQARATFSRGLWRAWLVLPVRLGYPASGGARHATQTRERFGSFQKRCPRRDGLTRGA